MERLLLVDGNNLAIRCAHAFNLSANLTDFSKPFNPDDVMDNSNVFPTGVLHGFFKSIVTLRGHFPEHYIAIAWDGGNKRRIDMTIPAVENHLVPEIYKANRKKEAPTVQMPNFLKQKDELQAAISMTNIPQIRFKGEEADDVIASYVTQYLERGTKIVIYTSDKDYYQLFSDDVSILRGDDLRDSEWFHQEYDIDPLQWVDVGALAGDSGDNIFGVPSWGEITSIRAIREYGSLGGLMDHLKKKHASLREKFPDADVEGVKTLAELATPSGKPKYPGVIPGMPFTGVALALEDKTKKCKIPKTELMALMFEERSKLAFELKRMYRDLELPDLPVWDRGLSSRFGEFCDKYNLKEVRGQTQAICAPQPGVQPIAVPVAVAV